MKFWDKNINKRKAITQMLIILFPLLLLFFLVKIQGPNSYNSDDSTTNNFSLQNVIKHIKEISTSPRAVGMIGHKKTEQYLINNLKELGLETDVQESFAVNTRLGLPYRTSFISNVLGRIKGTDKGNVVLLIAHYDSVSVGNGVSDNAVGVAVILETIKSLQNNEIQPKNDIVVLFSDAEEIGLLGAQAFVDEHKWAKQVKAVINLEARGTSGPSLLFETSENNSELIKSYAKSVKYPRASSFFSDAYKILPNDTDFTVFKQKGISGLNMAYIENVNHYHTEADNLENLSEDSVNNQGINLLSIINDLKVRNLDQIESQAQELVFFDLFGKTLIYYPRGFVLPLSAVALILFFAAIYLGRKAEKITIKGLIIGFFMFFLSLILAVISSFILYNIIAIFHQNYQLLITGDTYNSFYYISGIALLVTAQQYLIYSLLERKWNWESLYFGSLAWWVLLSVITSIFLPGTSYIFSLSAISILVVMLIKYLLKPKSKEFEMILLSTGSLVGIVLIAGIIRHLAAGLGFALIPIITFFIIFLVGLLIFQFLNLEKFLRKFTYTFLGLLGIALILYGIFTVKYTSNDPIPSNLFWAIDLDKNEALWASSDTTLNDWTTNIFENEATKASLPEFFPMTRRTFYQQKSEPLEIPSPVMEIISDEYNVEIRSIVLKIKSQRNAPIINLIVESEGEVLESFVEGKKVSDDTFAEFLRITPWETRIYGVPEEGVQISLKLKVKKKPLEIRIVEQSYGFPKSDKIKITSRPKNFVPILPFSDSIFSTKKIVIKD